MKQPGKRLLVWALLCALLVAFLPSPVSANSAEPPSLVFLISNPPDDLSIVLVSADYRPQAQVRRVAWEGYYIFYSHQLQTSGDYTFRASTSEDSFDFTIEAPIERYNNVYTLDLATRELSPGTYPLRSVLLVSMRLLLTLIIEGIIFWLFRFRQTRSWLVFLTINLVTQGALNILLNNDGSLLPGYLILGLIFGELFVFAAELIAFPLFVKEHTKGWVILYVLAANLASLVAGGYLISVLPV